MSMSQEEIEALMNGAGDLSEDDSQDADTSADENIDDILAGIDGITEDEPSEEVEENFDDILAEIDGVTDKGTSSTDSSQDTDQTANLEQMIDENKYPLPVEKEHKVVSQLNEVAEDSEEKASQIFDVLSFVLDENSEVQAHNKEFEAFITKQEELLKSLAVKFPNIGIFNENLELASKALESSKALNTRVENENMKIFEAMELMQYHDINRQKIERVMSVIKKLNDYLNGIFEDDTTTPEVQIAKHISGDSHDTVGADDIESLISEFSEG